MAEPNVRPYVETDSAPIADLLEDDSDPLWVSQGHTLHGPPRDGPRWRRTLVVEWDSQVVAAATVARNRVHPGRYNVAVEVGRRWRRRGIGTAVTRDVAALLPERRPLATKVRADDAAALGWLRSVGGSVYQRCPGRRVDPTAASTARWCDRQELPSEAALSTLDELPVPDRVGAWTDQYEWVHAGWSPADPGAIRELAGDLVGEADARSSVVVRRRGAVAALAWSFPEPDGGWTVVAETARRDQADGVALVAAGVAECFRLLAVRGVTGVDLDGHVSDPHLEPALRSVPTVAVRPLLLVEIDPVR